MDLGLKERVAIVTGSSRGIGKAIAHGLAEEGAKITICARNEKEAKATEQEIKTATGADVLSLRADLSHADNIKMLIRETYKAFGHIHINNTGGPRSTRFLATSEEDWGPTFSQLLMSVVLACLEVAPHMRRQRWGRIINMNSIAAKQPVENLVLSNSLRAGIASLTKTLSNEFAEDNILVNSVCPGYTLTERVQELAQAENKQTGKPVSEIVTDWAQTIPLKRMAEPREIVGLVVFLASERVSYITGALYQVDGGWIKGTM